MGSRELVMTKLSDKYFYFYWYFPCWNILLLYSISILFRFSQYGKVWPFKLKNETGKTQQFLCRQFQSIFKLPKQSAFFLHKRRFFSFLFCSNFAQIHCAKFSPLFSLIKKDQSWKVNITLVGVLCLLRAPLNFDGKQLGFEICTDIILMRNISSSKAESLYGKQCLY